MTKDTATQIIKKHIARNYLAYELSESLKILLHEVKK